MVVESITSLEQEEISEYYKAGTNVVWLIFPENKLELMFC